MNLIYKCVPGPWALFEKIVLVIDKGIIPEVKLVPEAKLRDTNVRVVLFPLSI